MDNKTKRSPIKLKDEEVTSQTGNSTRYKLVARLRSPFFAIFKIAGALVIFFRLFSFLFPYKKCT